MGPYAPTADWRDACAYRRLIGIDRAGLMWEWLRRDPNYIHWFDTVSHAMPVAADPAEWGLVFAEDPAVNASKARIIWSAQHDPAVLPIHVMPGGSDERDSLMLRNIAQWLYIADGAEAREHAVLTDGQSRERGGWWAARDALPTGANRPG